MDLPGSDRASDADRTLSQQSSGDLEWLETSESGDFALGTVDRKLRRKYHSLLTVREPGRGDAWNVLAEVREELTLLESPHGESAVLSDIRTGTSDSAVRTGFSSLPSATHHYHALDLHIARTVRLTPGRDQVELHYRISGLYAPVELSLEPMLLVRSIHELTFENPFLDGSFTRVGDELRMVPYAGMPAIAFRIDGIDRRRGAEGRFVHEGRWLTNVHYEWEAERGYPADEHLFIPGRFIVKLPDRTPEVELTFVIGLSPLESERAAPIEPAAATRATFEEKLQRATQQFVMHSRNGVSTVVAGFPWFGAWSRDTLIALPGVYLATGDFELVASVLEGMLKTRVSGLLPNIPAVGDYPPDTSSVDASLLFARTVQWLAANAGTDRVERFMPDVCALLEAIADGSDPRMCFDRGLGVWTQRGPWALTWMDALIDGQPVTPRAGYAVEIDALAYNAARFAVEWAQARGGVSASSFARAFRGRLRTAEADFVRRYWDDGRGYLADGHDGLRPDAALRPNQLFALGLPYRPVPLAIARASLGAVTNHLLVPAGLRTLSPHHSAYRGLYQGGQVVRDQAYHQGTVWPWLVGIYADAVVATHGEEALEQRLSSVLSFFARHIDHEGSVGQVSEVFSGDAPHRAGGAPAQAWSAAELYRVLRLTHRSTTAKKPS